jgi:PBP1b-binding outer membrane lipoprotein LpoB
MLAVGILALTLAGCSRPASAEQQAPANQNGISSQVVTLRDGSKVDCVRLYDHSIDCNWNGRWK